MTKSQLDNAVENEQQLEWNIFLSAIVKQRTSKLQNIYNAYKIIIEICQKFPDYLPLVNYELNKCYLSLIDLVENNLKNVSDLVDHEYYEDRADTLPSFYIEPKTLENNYYRPFANLHTAETEITEQKITWIEVYKKMNNFLGIVSKLMREVGQSEDGIPELSEVIIAKNVLNNLTQGMVPTESRIPEDWILDEANNKPVLKHLGKDILEFPNNWSNKFRYFKCLWNQFGHALNYKTIFEFENKGNYPSKNLWKANRNVRNTLTKFNNKELINTPFEIKINKGAMLSDRLAQTASN